MNLFQNIPMIGVNNGVWPRAIAPVAGGGAPIPFWRSALSRVANGSGQAKLLCVGDSNTSGVGTGPSNANRRLTSYPSRLAALYNGSAAAICGVAGSSTNVSDYATYDPRVAFGASWSGSDATLGGLLFAQSATTGPMVIDFAEDYDTVDVIGYFTSNTDIGYAFDGASYSAIAITDLAVLKKITLSIAQGSHSLGLRRSGGGNFRLCHVHAYSQSSPTISVLNAGMSGATSANISSVANPIASANMIAGIAPDMTVINIGINDAAALNVATFKANYQVAIDKAKLSGDVMLCVPIFVDPASTSQANQDAVEVAVKELAILNGLRVCNLRQKFGTYAEAVAKGWMADEKHPNGVGAEKMAEAVYASLA